MNKETFNKILKISEEYFKTESDPDQMPITHESARKLFSIHPDTVVYKFDRKGEPIGWVVVVPTSIDVMNRFINKKISEKELLDVAVKEKKFESIYLCGAFVLPEYRRKGYATMLVEEAINKVSNNKRLPLYTWIYSEEGGKLVDFLSGKTKQKIITRKD